MAESTFVAATPDTTYPSVTTAGGSFADPYRDQDAVNLR